MKKSKSKVARLESIFNPDQMIKEMGVGIDMIIRSGSGRLNHLEGILKGFYTGALMHLSTKIVNKMLMKAFEILGVSDKKVELIEKAWSGILEKDLSPLRLAAEEKAAINELLQAGYRKNAWILIEFEKLMKEVQLKEFEQALELLNAAIARKVVENSDKVV